jgi:hypothetical protein
MAAIVERHIQGRLGGGSKPKHATGNASRVFSVDVGPHETETRAEAHGLRARACGRREQEAEAAHDRRSTSARTV